MVPFLIAGHILLRYSKLDFTCTFQVANVAWSTQERFFVYNCSNMKIYSLFDTSAIVFNDCSSEIQQKRHLVGSSRQLVLIKALFYNGCTMS